MDPSSEGVESILHFHEVCEQVRSIQENWGDEGGSEAMTQVWGETFARGGEATDGIEGALGEGQSSGEVDHQQKLLLAS